jgi:hypothetical protein
MSMLLDYYRLAPKEREKVTHNEAAWREFDNKVVLGQLRAATKAIEAVNVDGLNHEQRMAKINEAIAKTRDPRDFHMEKDWHIIAYLLTGDAKIKEEHISNAPLHNVIFGGLKTKVESGYGPVRYFDSKLVAETVTALVSVDRKLIASRYDPAAMEKLQIYAPRPENEKQGILQVIEDLTQFFQKAAAAHEDIIKFLH